MSYYILSHSFIFVNFTVIKMTSNLIETKLMTFNLVTKCKIKPDIRMLYIHLHMYEHFNKNMRKLIFKKKSNPFIVMMQI